MVDEQVLFRSYLNGTPESLPVLESKEEGAKDEEIQCALQQFESVFWILGRHITRRIRMYG